MVIEARAEKGQLHSYIKPLLGDVQVFNGQQDVEIRNQSIFRSVWEPRVGAGEPC